MPARWAIRVTAARKWQHKAHKGHKDHKGFHRGSPCRRLGARNFVIFVSFVRFVLQLFCYKEPRGVSVVGCERIRPNESRWQSFRDTSSEMRDREPAVLSGSVDRRTDFRRS